MTTNKPTITESKLTATALYVSATCGKHSATISITDWEFRVIVHNASARRNRFSIGKGFRTASDALTHYKTAEIAEIIKAADALNR